jgi:hypothetical protein
LIDFGLKRKLYNSIPSVRHRFQISEMKIYKTYEGHRTQFCCFEAQRASWKTGIESDPNFLHSKCCLGLWPISQVSEVQKLKDWCHWKEDSIFYTFSRKYRSLNLHVSYLKSGPRYSERKGIRNREGIFFFLAGG